MPSISVDVDQELARRVMAAHGLGSEQDAAVFALEELLREARDEALALEGTGWDADLEELRGGSTPL